MFRKLLILAILVIIVINAGMVLADERSTGEPDIVVWDHDHSDSSVEPYANSSINEPDAIIWDIDDGGVTETQYGGHITVWDFRGN